MSDMPIELLAAREWNGTKWQWPNIERMVEENKRLRAELAAEGANTASLLHTLALIREAGKWQKEMLSELPGAVKAMREQRDEARRELCEMVARKRRKAGVRGQIVGLDRVTGEEIAAERGWDCFAQEGGGA